MIPSSAPETDRWLSLAVVLVMTGWLVAWPMKLSKHPRVARENDLMGFFFLPGMCIYIYAYESSVYIYKHVKRLSSWRVLKHSMEDHACQPG